MSPRTRTPPPPPQEGKKARRSRSIIYSLGLTGRPIAEIAPALVLHVVQVAEQGPRRGREATSPRKAIRKILDRAPLEWLTPRDRVVLLGECLRQLEEELGIRRLLREWRSLAWVAAQEGMAEEALREQLRDPVVRRHYAYPDYNPVSGEVRFKAARFDQAAQHRLTIPAREPAGRVLAPGWRVDEVR